jgi:hypothetical protein
VDDERRGPRRRPPDSARPAPAVAPGGRRRRYDEDEDEVPSSRSRRGVRYDDDDDRDDDDDEDDGPGIPLIRRLITAVVVLAAAFTIGIGAAVAWQKVHPSEEPAAGPAAVAPTAQPSSTTQPPPTTPAASGVAVPPDWVPFSDPKVRAAFSHPPNWAQRNNTTGVFFHEPSASGFGLQMIGVARVEGKPADAALNQVQQTEFGSAGLSNLTLGSPTPVAGSNGAFELTGTYERQGQKVAYTLRSVSAGDAVYVLFARTAASAESDKTLLLGALESSFKSA